MLQIKDGDRRLSMPFGHFSFFIFFFVSVSLYGDFEKFHEHLTAPVHSFKSQQDIKFQKELKKEWKGYKSVLTKSFYSELKPEKIPQRKAFPVQNVGPLVFIQHDINKTKAENKNSDLMFSGDTKVDFFGLRFYFSVNTIIKGSKFYPFNQDGIAIYFSSVLTSDYHTMIKEIESVQKVYMLNDWGVYQLVKKLADVIYKNSDEKELFQWFVLQKLGYDVKIALVGEHVYSLYNIKQKLYGAISIRYDKKLYYLLTHDIPSNTLIYVHKQGLKNKLRPLNLSLKKLPLIAQKIEKKEIKFNDYAKEYRISFLYNRYLIDFFRTYPQTDFEVYINAPIENITYNSLVNSLKIYLNGMRTNKALNFILHFIQKGFVYQRDQEHFGRQKTMFAEETLFYTSSDCEDRVSLFNYLVRKLFGIDIYALKYKNYMCSALYIPLEGDSVHINLKRYIIADPTYINANIGMIFPVYKGKRPDAFIQNQLNGKK